MPSYASYIVSIIHALGTTDDENVPPSMRMLYVGRTFCGKFVDRDDVTYETRIDVAHCYLIRIMCIHVHIHINRPIYVVDVTDT